MLTSARTTIAMLFSPVLGIDTSNRHLQGQTAVLGVALVATAQIMVQAAASTMAMALSDN